MDKSREGIYVRGSNVETRLFFARMGNNFFTKYLQIGEKLMCHLEIYSLDGNKSRRKWLQRHQLKEVEQLLYEPIKARLEEETRKEVKAQSILTGITIRLGYVFKKKSENHTLILPSDSGDEDLYHNAYNIYREKVVVFVSSLESQQTGGVNKLVKALHDCCPSQASPVSISNYFTKPSSGNYSNKCGDGKNDQRHAPCKERRKAIKNMVGNANKAISKAKKDKRIAKIVHNMKEIEENIYNDVTERQNSAECSFHNLESASNDLQIKHQDTDGFNVNYGTLEKQSACFVVKGPQSEVTCTCINSLQSKVDYIDIELDCNNEGFPERYKPIIGQDNEPEHIRIAKKGTSHGQSWTSTVYTVTDDPKSVCHINYDNKSFSSGNSTPTFCNTTSTDFSTKFKSRVNYLYQKCTNSANEMPNILNINSPSFESHPNVIKLEEDFSTESLESGDCPEKPPMLPQEASNETTDVHVGSSMDQTPMLVSDGSSGFPKTFTCDDTGTKNEMKQSTDGQIPVDHQSQSSFADDESSDSDLPDYGFVTYNSRRRMSLFQKALDICEHLQCESEESDVPPQETVMQINRKRTRHVLPSFTPTQSDEELDLAKTAKNQHDDNFNEVSGGGILCTSGMVMDNKIGMVCKISELTPDQLRYLVLKNKKYLKSIFQGLTESRRHMDFKKGGRSRQLLNHQVQLGLFTEEQMDVIMETLMSIFCKKHHKYLDYVMKVLLPETLVKIQSVIVNQKI